MQKNQNNVASFVLRFTQELWNDEQGEPKVQWRGHIHHVQGHEEDRFVDFTEAVVFIQRYLTQLTLNALAGGQPMQQARVLQESFKMWERFANNYTDMMREAMESTARQSQLLREHIDHATESALHAWQIPAFSNLQPPEQTQSQQLQQEEPSSDQSEAAPPAPEESTGQSLAAERQVVESLQALQAQIQVLTDKVQQLEQTLQQERSRQETQIETSEEVGSESETQ